MVRRSGRSHPNSQIVSGARRFSQFCHQNQFYTLTCCLLWWTLRNCQISSGARCRYCISQIRKPFYLVFCLLFAYKHFCERRRIGVGTFVFGARSSWLEFRNRCRRLNFLFFFLTHLIWPVFFWEKAATFDVICCSRFWYYIIFRLLCCILPSLSIQSLINWQIIEMQSL